MESLLLLASCVAHFLHQVDAADNASKVGAMKDVLRLVKEKILDRKILPADLEKALAKLLSKAN